MFKKPFRVKSQSVMKGSDRKKLKAEIQKTFSSLTPDEITEILPSKAEVTTVKIYCHSGENAFIYCVNKQPMLFEIDKQKVIYPTVYLLWKIPDLVERFTTWPPVFKRLTDGADLMLPGVVVREQVTPNTFKHIYKGQICSVNIAGNRCPVAVGYSLMSGSDFYDSGMKGKGIHPVHILGDALWEFGDKSTPANVEDDPIPSHYTDDADDISQPTTGEPEQAGGECGNERTDGNGANNGTHDGAICGATNDPVDYSEDADNTDDDNTDRSNKFDYRTVDSGGDICSGVSDVMDTACASGGEGATGAAGCVQDLDIAGMDLQEGSIAVITIDEMDELLQLCFLCAIKASVKKTDLPLPTGTFYKQHMQKYCPKNKHLDIKKSSFKKLSKFLQKQMKTGIIKVKEQSKGVDSIVETDRSHDSLRGLEVPDVLSEEDVTMTIAEFVPPKITEMFAVTSNLLPLFKHMGYSKGSALKSGDVRKNITEYVRSNDLQSEQSNSDVVLDPILAEILLTKAEGDKSTLKWDEVFSRLLNKMSPVYEMAFLDQKPVIKKGQVEPIQINVVQRGANKKATIVENLPVFGIEPKEFAHRVQIKVACSASVVPSQQKNKGPQVAIQGNQIMCVADLLANNYKIPRKYLQGIEKAPKSRRK